ncbi:DUF2145 domain-containing protein [Janthinobacterium fluminis]|uniref:DUF2145 domain-containing protein n=1 Tax=Janthinobacterium fluminis TaxID=2987524 RepID=A0ABT5K265_9BURK|nr:DUF2145 domain-containing protein [Janthinobacterium fluminis]MDC8759065.1 DUF2145 domain-containing protein [Janthinobacterium fluminis]
MSLARLALPALLLALAAPAQAGRPCEPKAGDPAIVVKSLDLAYKARQALDASGAQVALIARAGQDLSKYNLRYSHMALAWRDHPAGRWVVVHELNDCGSAESALFNEGLGNFFLDDIFEYKTSILVPNAATQAALARLLASDTPRRLHGAHYNMLAYPYSTKYQNSNQWVLETYAAASAAQGKIENRDEAQAWLKKAGYAPITLHIPATTRLGARMFRANIAFDDHPFDRRMAGQIDTVTVDSMQQFIKRRDIEVREINIAAD